jgi:hypothetical protein
MSARTARGNRLGLALVGLALLACAAYTLVRGSGELSALPAGEPIIPAPLRELALTNSWFWPAVAVAAGVVALLALRWLLVQARSDRLDRLVLDEDERGASYVDARAFGSVVADEVAALPGVRRARALLVGAPDGAQLHLRVAVDENVDVDQLRSGVQETLRDARHALEDSNLPAVVRIRLRAGRHATRVT